MKKLFFFYFTILFILFSCSKGSTENPEEPKSEEPDTEEPITDEENTYFTIFACRWGPKAGFLINLDEFL